MQILQFYALSGSNNVPIIQYSQIYGYIVINGNIKPNNKSLSTWQNNSFSQFIYSIRHNVWFKLSYCKFQIIQNEGLGIFRTLMCD